MNASPGHEDVFLVLVSGKPGREAAYGRWFTGRHMADMRALEGVGSALAYAVETTNGVGGQDLCAIYEFSAGPDVLNTIGRLKGTDALPTSDDQGPMVWRLFETVAAAPPVALPQGADLWLALFGGGRDQLTVARLQDIARALSTAGASYVRALKLSSIQPARGSDVGAAVVVVWEQLAGATPQEAATRIVEALAYGSSDAISVLRCAALPAA